MIATDSVASPQRRTVQRSVAWIVLAASAAAVATIGLVTTTAILSASGAGLAPVPRTFWAAIAAGALGICISFGIRTLRWVFLLRRSGVRIPIRDACIAYLSGFSLLLVPLLVGEAVVRAYIHHNRARVPPATTVAVNVWERVLDISAMAFIAAVAVASISGPGAAVIPAAVFLITALRPFRAMALTWIVAAVNPIVRRVAPGHHGVSVLDLADLSGHGAWTTAVVASIAAWALPGAALWALAASWQPAYGMAPAQLAYASSALSGGLAFAPGGIRVVGAALIANLTASGLADGSAAVTVLAIRLLTAGLATVLGGMFVWLHLRTRPLESDTHFDDIAHVYDAQIPAAQRESLLTRKTALMQAAIARYGAGRRGLDAGCGQGWYVARMRALGFDVHGIDASARQIALAQAQVGDSSVIAKGTLLRVNAPDASFDFVYTINVLHHLGSVDEQRAAFAELLRVLRPGGLLFVHEINTRNVLFRFYMGYLFPSLNFIDEGTERWLLPHLLANYTSAPVVEASYFTFMPEFVPAFVLRLLRPVEALLEASPLRVYSAHYMSVLRKPASTT